MNKTNYLSNLRVETLNSNTDLLGIIHKGELIKDFLIGSKASIHEIKMFCLFGDWGSGKSTLMKYLDDNLQNEFNTFFFEAWEFEKDENLALSLLEYLTIESNSISEEFCKDVLKYGGRLLRSLGKSIKLNIPLFPNGPGIDLDPAAFVEEMSKNQEVSFYEALKAFKTKFVALEDFITKGDKPKYNIVFIDDLDRCEPGQVLNLMSAIKLFFTYGSKTIFFCGIDKSAVESAVKTKYGKAVKSNEYLEKIFDISFSMPSQPSLQLLINHYFDNRKYCLGNEQIEINLLISTFFRRLEFTNPRRLKKVLNKFQMLRNFKQMNSVFSGEVPNIDMKSNSEKNYFETILVLYLIILHEFYSDYFENFLNFSKKRQIYSKTLEQYESYSSSLENVLDNNFSGKSFKEIAGYEFNSAYQSRFIICISPINVEKIHINSLDYGNEKRLLMGKRSIDYLFYKYINRKPYIEWVNIINSSDQSFASVKKIIKDFL